MSPIAFALLAALSFGFWTAFHKLASPHINQIFGAIVVSLTAAVIGLVILVPKLKNVELVQNQKGVYFLVLAGLCAFLIDYFVLQAYSKGLPVSIGGPIIIGGSIAVTVLIGFILGDSITIAKMFGLLLLLSGAVVLSIFNN